MATINLKWEGKCSECGAILPVGSQARYYGRGIIYGLTCHEQKTYQAYKAEKTEIEPINLPKKPRINKAERRLRAVQAKPEPKRRARQKLVKGTRAPKVPVTNLPYPKDAIAALDHFKRECKRQGVLPVPMGADDFGRSVWGVQGTTFKASFGVVENAKHCDKCGTATKTVKAWEGEPIRNVSSVCPSCNAKARFLKRKVA